MYYSDLLAAKDISWGNFCTLVDVSLYEAEEERVRLAEKGKAKCQEESDSYNRVFRLFPRKTRTFVPRRRNPLHGASTSPSSFLQLLDSRNPLNPSCSKGLRVTAGPEKRNPPNPNSQLCLAEKPSHKRRAVEQRKPSGALKKAKVAPLLLSWKGRDTPESVLRILRVMNATQQNPKLIFERLLFKTDVNPTQSRLSMPISQVISDDFLTPVEARIIRQDIKNSNKVGVAAILVNEHSQRWDVRLKRWESEGSWSYTLTCGWNHFVKANRLDTGQGISVWTFRCSGLLCFALVPLPTTPTRTY